MTSDQTLSVGDSVRVFRNSPAPLATIIAFSVDGKLIYCRYLSGGNCYWERAHSVVLASKVKNLYALSAASADEER